MQYPGRMIKAGEADAVIVRALKARLNEALQLAPGSPLRLDETNPTFGDTTALAVKAFQARHVDAEGRPLLQDGKVGSITWAILFGDDSVAAVAEAHAPLLERLIATAEKELAARVREVPANTNRGPRVEQYLRRVGVAPGNSWCCAFVYWCFDEAAKSMPRKNPMVKTAGCLDHWQKATAAGARRIPKARAVADPSLLAPGHVFIMDHGGGFGHTGIVTAVNGGLLSTIEGNTDASRTREGGGVYRLTRKVGEINTGFIDYSAL